MTTPSETRAAQRRALTGALDRLAFYCDDNASRRSDVAEVRMLAEALAASEPVEAETWTCPNGHTYASWMRYHDNCPACRNTHPAPEQPGKGEAGELGRFSHHPDAAIDFEIEVQSLEARLFDAQHGISKMGTQPDQVADVLAAIQKAMTFRVGGIESCVRAKATLRDLEAKATPQPSDPAEGAKRWPFVESPGEFTARLEEAMRHFPLIGAVRHVLIENPAALSTPPTAAVRVASVCGTPIREIVKRLTAMRASTSGLSLDELITLELAEAALTAALDPQVKKQD